MSPFFRTFPHPSIGHFLLRSVFFLETGILPPLHAQKRQVASFPEGGKSAIIEPSQDEEEVPGGKSR